MRTEHPKKYNIPPMCELWKHIILVHNMFQMSYHEFRTKSELV